MSQSYEVIAYTALVEHCIDKLLDLIDPERKYFHHRLIPEHCVKERGNYVKDLTMFGKFTKICLFSRVTRNQC